MQTPVNSPNTRRTIFWYGSVTTAPYEVYLDLTLYPQHTQFHYIKDITYRSVVSIPNNEEIACVHQSNIYSEHYSDSASHDTLDNTKPHLLQRNLRMSARPRATPQQAGTCMSERARSTYIPTQLYSTNTHIKVITVPTDTVHIAQVREYSAIQHYAYSF